MVSIIGALSFWEIALIILAVAMVVFTVVFNIVRRKKGKSSCGCEGCPSAGSCSKSCCGSKGEDSKSDK